MAVEKHSSKKTTSTKKHSGASYGKHDWISLVACCAKPIALVKPRVNLVVDVAGAGSILIVKLKARHLCGIRSFNFGVVLAKTATSNPLWRFDRISGQALDCEKTQTLNIDITRYWAAAPNPIPGLAVADYVGPLPENLSGFTVTVDAIVENCCGIRQEALQSFEVGPF